MLRPHLDAASVTFLNESTLASMNRRSCGATGGASDNDAESFPSIAEETQSADAAPDWLRARMSNGPLRRSAGVEAAAASRLSGVAEQSELAEWSVSRAGSVRSSASVQSSRAGSSVSSRPSQASASSALQRGALLSPSQLWVAVKQVDKTSDRKLVFVIECELDGVIWSVLRRERQVSELHGALTQLMRFVPGSPIAARSWIWGRAAEHSGAVAKRVQDFLRELTATGQWVWDEMAVLRHFLQIPISSEKRQARDLVLNEIRSHKIKDARKLLLGDIRKDDGAAQRGRLSNVQGSGSGDGSGRSSGSGRGSVSSRADSPHASTPASATAATAATAAAAADSAEAAEAATPATAPTAATAAAGTPASPRFFSPWSPLEGEGGGFLRGIVDTLDSARSHLRLTPTTFLFAAYYLGLTTDYLLLTAHYSLLTAHYVGAIALQLGRQLGKVAQGQAEHLTK